jgi:hypothetical protein
VRRRLLSGVAIAPTLFHLVGQVAHGFLRGDTSFTACDGSLRCINGCQDFGACPLALLPQGEGLLHRVFLTAESSAFNPLTDKCFLVGAKMNIHGIQGRRTKK